MIRTNRTSCWKKPITIRSGWYKEEEYPRRLRGNLANKDKTFQGQKFDDDLGLNYYSFKYRNHDPQIGRFTEIDPLSDKYVGNSTYAFSENKVTNHVELEGLETTLPAQAATTPIFSPGTAHGSANDVNLFPNLDHNLEVFSQEVVYTVMEEIFIKPPKHMGFFERLIHGAISIVDRVFSSSDDKESNSSSSNETSKTQAQQRAEKLSQKSREGQDFTKAGKDAVIELNKEKNSGKAVCENCKIETKPAKKSKRGVTPPKDETQVDHIKRKREGGSGTPDNGQVLCRGCNLEKH